MWWAFLSEMESRSLLVMIMGAFGNGYKEAQSVSEVTLVLGSVSVALGQDSTEDTGGCAPVSRKVKKKRGLRKQGSQHKENSQDDTHAAGLGSWWFTWQQEGTGLRD